MSSTTFYCRRLLKSINQFRKHQSLHDVILVVDGRQFPAHRIILSAASPYFLGLFSSEMKETIENRVTLTNISSSVMDQVLTYIYTGAVDVDEANVEDLIIAADFLLLSNLKQRASEFLRVNLGPENCLSMKLFSEIYACEDLGSYAKSYILTNFIEISDSHDFKALASNDLLEIIGEDDLCATEEDVFEALVRWTKVDLETRKCHFYDLFRSIRLTYLAPDYMKKFLENEELIKSNSLCLQRITSAKKYLSSPEQRSHFAEWSGIKPRKRNIALVTIGGLYRGRVSSAASCFLPSSCSWFQLSPLAVPRYLHSAAVCNGAIYVVGGWSSDGSGERLASVEKYDPINDSWTKVKAALFGVTGAGLGVLDGILYAVGGSSSQHLRTTNAVQRYDPELDLWDLAAPMLSERNNHCVTISNNCLYAIGGEDRNGNCLSSVEVYQPANDRWVYIMPMNHRRTDASAASVRDNIYVMGGLDGYTLLDHCEMYSPTLEVWRIVSYTSFPRYSASISVIEDYIYLVGGYDEFGQTLDHVECYNTKNNYWENVGNMPKAMQYVACCAVPMAGNVVHHISKMKKIH